MPISARRNRASRSSSSVVISTPATRTLPALARSSPASTISRLVLPEPDLPTSPTASPEARSSETPRRMLTGPPGAGRVRCRSRIRTSAPAASSAPAGTGGATMRSIPPPYRTVLPRREVMRALGGLALLGLAAGAAASPRLLILGDSLTAGFGLAAAEGFQAQLRAALQTHGRAVMLIDAAVSGDTCAGGRARLDWALADGADAALVELGGNDALRGTDPQECAADLAAILDTLAARHI